MLGKTLIIDNARGGGGEQTAWVLKNYPSTVKQSVFLEVYPSGQEFIKIGREKNFTAKQLEDYKQLDLKGRSILSGIILGLAIPWGLMPIFVPAGRDPTYYPPEKWGEFRAQLWTSKAWITQYYGIISQSKSDFNKSPLNSFGPFSPSVPLIGINWYVSYIYFLATLLSMRLNSNAP